MRVAVVGKGGAGKSLIAGTVARLLARRGHRVLAVDCDAVPGMEISLGVPVSDARYVDDAAERTPDGSIRLRKGIGPVRLVRDYAAVAPDGVRLLRFGSWTAGGFGRERAAFFPLWMAVQHLHEPATLRNWTIVGDLSAGPKQAAMGWAQWADTFLVVLEATPTSALTARRIARILRATGGVAVLPVANKVSGRADADRAAELLGEPLFGCVPSDDAVRIVERAGEALVDRAPESASARALDELVSRLQHRSGPNAP